MDNGQPDVDGLLGSAGRPLGLHASVTPRLSLVVFASGRQHERARFHGTLHGRGAEHAGLISKTRLPLPSSLFAEIRFSTRMGAEWWLRAIQATSSHSAEAETQ